MRTSFYDSGYKKTQLLLLQLTLINLWELLISDKSFAYLNVQRNEITLISLRVDDDTGIMATETEMYWTAYWKLK